MSSETSPFDRTHNDFLFDFNRKYASILYRYRVIARLSSKVANFNPPHLHLLPPHYNSKTVQDRRIVSIKGRIGSHMCYIKWRCFR